MQLLKECLFVGMGGFIGAVLRFLLSLIPLKTNFPFMTFFVNLSGAVLIGIIAGAAVCIPNISSHLILFLRAGVCGGYTTLSGMSIEVLDLFRSNHGIIAIIYIVLTITLCVLGVLAGETLAQAVLKR